jgi:TadE-like protein
MRKNLAGERGQSTVELALCLPILALVLTAAVEVSLLALDQVRLWHAAREAARVAVVDPDEDAIREAAEDSGLDHLRVSVDPGPAHRVQGEPLTARLAYTPDARVLLLEPLLSRLELRATSVMRIEQP